MKYFYIYNYRQAKYFIDNGLKVIDINTGKKNDIYHKFLRDKIAEKVFMDWKKRKYGKRAI